MKRFLVVFLTTLLIGGIVFLIFSFIPKSEEIIEEQPEEEEEVYIDPYSNEIVIEDLLSTVADKETLVVFIGNKDEEVTKNVGEVLSQIKEVADLNLYYIENSSITTEIYQELVLAYPDLADYIKFSPVILVFKDKNFVGGLPGEVDEMNITTFFSYTEIT